MGWARTRNRAAKVARHMGSGHRISAQGANAASGIRMQYAALCWRIAVGDPEPGVEILLITSRDTGRWIIPKGWPMPGLAPEAAAAEEAWEEAGVAGEIDPVSLGRYGYQKVFTVEAQVPCAVSVYALRVLHQADAFPEVLERRRKWFAQEDAAGLVQEPDLGRLIAKFVPPADGKQAPIVGE